MTKSIKLKVSTVPTVRLADPRTREVAPDAALESLGAEPVARHRGGGSPLALSALRNALFASLRSSGGRPGLDGAVRRQKIPMSDEDWRVLELVSAKLGESGLVATPGQIAGQLLRDAIAALRQSSAGVYRPSSVPAPPLRVCDASVRPPASPQKTGLDRMCVLKRALSKAERRVAA
jgi:hypothetical protein